MSNTSLDIDAVLDRAGAAWRGTQLPPPEPDLARLTRTVRPARRVAWWAPAAAVAAVTLVLVLVGVPLMTHHRPSGPTRFGQPTLPPDTGTGVAVTGTGTLYRNGDGPILLCSDVGSTYDNPPSTFFCGKIAVPTTGVDPSLLGSHSRKGQAASETVRVEGLYHDGTLAVHAVHEASGAPVPGASPPPLPCPAPADGWLPDAGFSSGSVAAASDALNVYIGQHLDRFAQLWVSYPDGHPDPASPGPQDSQPPRVVVVGTTDDPATVRGELATIYPGNLCVHRVRFNFAQLDRIMKTLDSLPSTPTTVSELTTENKLAVTVIALDAETVRALGQVDPDALVVTPMLTPR